MNSANETSSGWKWAAIVVAVLLVMTLTCVIASVTGGLFGYLVGRRTTVTRSYRMPEPFPEMPREWEPMPPDIPDRAPSPDDEGTPWLGVAFMMVDEGAEVGIVVPGSPADEAGVEIGDVITAVDGNRVTESRPLDEHILRYDPGDEIQLTILRNGNRRRINVRLRSQADRFPGRHHQGG